MSTDETTTSLQLDPKEFPKRIEVELSEEATEKIRALAQKTGRSLSEVATDILSKATTEAG